MKVLLLVFLFLGGLTRAQDFSSFEKKEFRSEDQVLPYRILYPVSYDKSKKYPLILLLHGGGERGVDNEKQLTHGASLFLKPEYRTEFPCIVIVPQCPEQDYWASVKFDRANYPLALDFNYEYPLTTSLRMAIELTKSIVLEEAVDKKRIYVMGLSMGGMGTLEAVYRFPSLFAAAVPICGGGDTDSYTRKQVKPAFWLFHGDVDGVIPVRHSREMFNRLKSLKATVKYTEYPGVNHNSWVNAFAEPDLIPWLFANHK